MRQDGYFTIDRAVLARLPDIGCTAMGVYLVLASHADEDGRCWPSVDAIGRAIGCGCATVKRAIRTLKDAGLINQQRRRQSTAIYTIQEGSPVSHQEQEGSSVSLRGLISEPQEGSSVSHRTTTIEREPRTKSARRKKTQPKYDPLAADLPFDSAAFRTAWLDFCEHRRAGKTSLNQAATKRILAKLGRWGEAKAVEALDNSIENDWRGVFEPRSNGKQAAQQPGTCKVLTVEEYANWNPYTGGTA